MQQFRRTLAALAVAAMLPTIVLSAVQVTITLADQRRETERVLVERSERVVLRVDARIQADASGLRALSTAQTLANGRVRDFARRADDALALEPGWTSIRVTDAQTGATLASVPAKTGEEGDGLTSPALATPAGKGAYSEPAVTLSADGRTLFITVAAPRQTGPPRYLVTLGVDGAVFQRALTQSVSPGEVAALVMPDGRFLGRTADYEAQRGQPASRSLRKAISTGASGVYRGVTLEGMENYTGFATSAQTRISAHIATSRWTIDQARVGSTLVVLAAGIAGLVVAAVLAWLVLRELAERRRVDAALAQAQKMEAVGRMAGGIAHDFNNIVAAFGSGLRLIAREDGLSERGRSVLGQLEAAVERALALSRRLLDFSRVQTVEIESVDVAETLHAIEHLIRHTIGPSIELAYDVEPDVGHAQTNAHQLEMAVLNLAANARDAMPEGGRLVVSAGAAPTKQPMIEIAVADTGVGMSSETRERALEPFFTTKPPGQGTGLGLAQVFSLARRSKGEVDVQSAPGAGTRVRILLPRA